MKLRISSTSFQIRLKLKRSISKMSKLSTKNMQIRLKRRLRSLRKNKPDSRTKTLSSGRSLNPIRQRYQKRLLSLTQSNRRSRSTSMNSNQKSKSLLKKQNFSKRIAPAQHVPKIFVMNLGKLRSKMHRPQQRTLVQNSKLSLKSLLKMEQILRSRLKYRMLSRTNSINYYLTISDSGRFRKTLYLREVISEKCKVVEKTWHRQRRLLRAYPSKRTLIPNSDYTSVSNEATTKLSERC